MFDCGHKSQYMGVQREKFVRYQLISVFCHYFLNEKAFLSTSVSSYWKYYMFHMSIINASIDLHFALTWLSIHEGQGEPYHDV